MRVLRGFKGWAMAGCLAGMGAWGGRQFAVAVRDREEGSGKVFRSLVCCCCYKGLGPSPFDRLAGSVAGFAR